MTGWCAWRSTGTPPASARRSRSWCTGPTPTPAARRCRPRRARRRPIGRPTRSPGSEPVWWPTGREKEVDDLPARYELRVWADGAGWRSLGWFRDRALAGVAAAALGVGADGARYSHGVTIGLPSADVAEVSRDDDVSEEDRAVLERHPDHPAAAFERLFAHQTPSGAAWRGHGGPDPRGRGAVARGRTSPGG